VEANLPRILRVDPRRPDARALAEAVAALRRGELVVVPTETVYGLAADARAPGALDKIYEAKGRPKDKALAFFATDVDEIRKSGAAVSGAAERLARAFWPGPLTLVLPKNDGFEGFRVPDHEVALELLRKAGTVLAVTSANRSGLPPALNASDAAYALGSSVALVLDAGPSDGGVPSTVVKVTGDDVEILREGAISRDEIFTTAQR